MGLETVEQHYAADPIIGPLVAIIGVDKLSQIIKNIPAQVSAQETQSMEEVEKAAEYLKSYHMYRAGNMLGLFNTMGFFKSFSNSKEANSYSNLKLMHEMTTGFLYRRNEAWLDRT